MKPLQELDISKKKLFIFDMDGTLIDSIGIWNEVDSMLVENQTGEFHEPLEMQKERDRFLGSYQAADMYVAYSAYLRDKYGFKMQDAAAILELRQQIAHQALCTKVDYKPKAPEVLHTLKAQGKKLALATVTRWTQLRVYAEQNEAMRAKVSMDDVFDYIVTKEDVHHSKPDPEIYEKVLDHFAAAPQEALVLEDSYVGVLAAKRAGIEVVSVYDVYSDGERSSINELADYGIQSFDEFLQYIK